MVKMTSEQRDELVARWRAAYERANGKPWPYEVRYERGYFVSTLHEEGYARETRHRASHIIGFIDNLNRYAERQEAIGQGKSK